MLRDSRRSAADERCNLLGMVDKRRLLVALSVSQSCIESEREATARKKKDKVGFESATDARNQTKRSRRGEGARKKRERGLGRIAGEEGRAAKKKA